MIYLVHGSDPSSSRKLIVNQFTNKNTQNKIEICAEDISPDRLFELVRTGDIFGNPPFIILDISNLLSQSATEFVSTVSKTPKDATLIIYCSRALPAANVFLKSAAEFGIKVVESELKIESNVFKFVDALFEKNRTQTYLEMQKLLKEDNDHFYLFSMILYGLRNLLGASLSSKKFLSSKPFQKQKLEKQIKNFGSTDFSEIFEYYYNLEKKAKTGDISSEIMLTLAAEKMLNF